MTLIVDLLALDAARIDVARIHGEFAEAGDRSEALADAVGYPRLGERVQAFADNWDKRRGELTEQLAVVRDGLQGIVAGFEQVDRELARALADQRTTYPPHLAPEPA
jgi:hypothetical protein